MKLGPGKIYIDGIEIGTVTEMHVTIDYGIERKLPKTLEHSFTFELAPDVVGEAKLIAEAVERSRNNPGTP